MVRKPIHLLKIYLAKQYAKLYPKDTFIGVAGSVGKTTTVEACNKVLSLKYKTITTQPNLDPIVNIPNTILRLNPSIKRAVLEMGVEYKGEMDFYLSLFKPKTVIITRIYWANSEFLGSLEQILSEQGRLVEKLPDSGVAILNFDDVSLRKLAEKVIGKVIFFGKDPKNCLVWAGNIRVENFKTTFELNLGVERVKINYKLLGEHQIYAALAAAVLGVLEGIPLTKIKIALESQTPKPHHLQALEGPYGAIILDDSLNSSPASVEAAIDTLMQVPARRRVAVLGQMPNLGSFSEDLHRQIAQKIYKEKLDFVLLGQGETQIIADELMSLGFWEERIEANLQNSQLVSWLLKTLGTGDVCLIKGSKASRLDEVVKRITKA